MTEAEVEVRPARPEDKEAVLAFCEHTWEDHEDYIPYVWDDWLADPNGCLFVAVVDGQPVAIERVALMSDREAWWEGLRVDPRYRGRGLVGAMRPHLRRYLREHRVAVSRMATSSRNTIVHGMAARRGMQRVGRYVLYEADAVESTATELTQLTPDDFDAAWALLTDSDIFAGVHRLYVSRGWAWQELTPQQLRTRLAGGKVWGLRRAGQLTALAILSPAEGGDDRLWIGYADGTSPALPVLLRELRRLAYLQDHPQVGGHFPILERVLHALEDADYHRAWEPEMWVYEAHYDTRDG